MTRGRHASAIGRRRGGFTLVEFSVSSVIVGILMVGLVSCIHLVTRAARLTEGPTSKTVESARLIDAVLTDLRLAQVFNERTSNAVEFTIPDRDGDETAEIVRYQWTGGPELELRKTIDHSADASVPTATVIATGVRNFNLDYLTKNWGSAAPAREVESEEVLLAAHDIAPVLNLNRVLLVVNDSTSLAAQETARQALMQSWGFAVEPISATATQAEFDDAATRNDVAYVSCTVPAADVGNKLRYAFTGVVNEVPELADELGFSALSGNIHTTNMLDESIGTHYIARGLLPGNQVKLFTTSQPLQGLGTAAANLSADIQLLGHRGGDASLAVLEKGAELYQPASVPLEKFGEPLPLALKSGTTEFDKIHLASQFHLTKTVEAISMSAYLESINNKEVRYGIYTDVAGEPGTLIAQTPNSAVPNNGANWFTLNFGSTFILEPGTYWLAVGMQADMSIFYEEIGGTSRYANSGNDPRDGMQTTWSGTYGATPNNRRFAVHLSYYETAVANGRRVQLPWGFSGTDIQSLSEAGQGMMRRAIQWATENTPYDDGEGFAITSHAWPAQYVLPDLPSNATGWQITRAFVRLRAPAVDVGGSVWFRLVHANLTGQPSAFSLRETYAIASNTWPSDKYRWYEVPFSATGDLPPDSGVCVILGGTLSAANAYVNYDDSRLWMTPGTHYSESTNQGANWSTPDALRDMRYYVYGKYFTQGDPVW